MKLLLATAALAGILLASPALAGNYVEVGAGAGINPNGSASGSIQPDVSVIVGTTVPLTDFRVEAEASNEFSAINAKAPVNATTLGVNVDYDFPAYRGVRPYVFGGYGEAFLDGRGVVSGHTSPFYDAGVGANYKVNANWTVGARYKFEQTNDQVYTATGHDDYRVNSLQFTVTHPF